jgi:hypothetical protein
LTSKHFCGIVEIDKREEIRKMFYWFTFADGYCECVRGYDRVEKKHMEMKHGKIVRKERV